MTDRYRILHGDSLALLPTLEEASIDAIVTDPPYGLSFMGKAWDYGVPGVAFWVEMLRVLKPGGHLLAFGGTRTFHRMAVAIEDAGFEVRDCLSWLYGSGFPKSLNVGKAIDKRGGSIPWQQEFAKHLRSVKPEDVTVAQINSYVAMNGSKSNFWGHFIDTTSQPLLPTAEQYRRLRELLPIDAAWDQQFLPEAEREVVGTKTSGIANRDEGPRHTIGASKAVTVDVTAPATEEAARWDGWGTALKPAWEPIIMARKPLKGTVAGNVLQYGTGALNIDGNRIGTDGGTYNSRDALPSTSVYNDGLNGGKVLPLEGLGRWPANVLLDEVAAGMLDEQSGVSKDGVAVCRNRPDEGSTYEATSWYMRKPRGADVGYGGSGGASRFFYVAKASKRDRNEGLEEFQPKREADRQKADGAGGDNPRNRSNTAKLNHHPTVKPTALMRHLVKLVTPPNGIVLDPFMGSGSTGKAAMLEGFQFIGIDQEAEYVTIAEARIAHALRTYEDAVEAGQQVALF